MFSGPYLEELRCVIASGSMASLTRLLRRLLLAMTDYIEDTVLVLRAVGVHPFPFRTGPLSPPASMILEAQASGKVDQRQHSVFYFAKIYPSMNESSTSEQFRVRRGGSMWSVTIANFVLGIIGIMFARGLQRTWQNAYPMIVGKKSLVRVGQAIAVAVGINSLVVIEEALYIIFKGPSVVFSLWLIPITTITASLGLFSVSYLSYCRVKNDLPFDYPRWSMSYFGEELTMKLFLSFGVIALLSCLVGYIWIFWPA
jgi:hypothetical protein